MKYIKQSIFAFLFLFIGGLVIENTVYAQDVPQAEVVLPGQVEALKIKGASSGNYQPVFTGPGLDSSVNRVQESITGKGLTTERSIIILAAAWLRFFLPIIALAAILAVIYAGYTYVTGGGDDGRYEKAKSIVIWVVVGLVVILGAYAIVNTLIRGLTFGENTII